MARKHSLKELPHFEKKALHDFFEFPYHGFVYLYNNLLSISLVQDENFHTLLSHNFGQQGYSTAMALHDLMEKAIGGFAGKKVLDVGSSLGHFSFLMVEDGAEVVAVEKESLRAGASRGISLVKGYQDRLQVIESPIEEYLAGGAYHFDVALVMNVFDHMLRDSVNRAWVSMYRISNQADNMFLMVGPVDGVFNGVDHTSNIPEVIISKTEFNHCNCLVSRSYADRGLFHFWK